MGTCSSKPKIDFKEWDNKTYEIVILLNQYRSANFSNEYQSLICKEMIKLKKLAMKTDPYMYCKNPKKKEKLRLQRLNKNNDEILLLKKIWEICILCQHFESWDLTKIKKNFLKSASDRFLEKREEILNILKSSEKI